MTKERVQEQENSISMGARKADGVDKHVGNKLREYRRALDLTQQDISDQIGISYQQVQKYETGTNRISAGRLYLLAEILGIKVQKFYEGFENGPASSASAGSGAAADYTERTAPTLKTDIGDDPKVRSALTQLLSAIKDADQ